MADSERTRSAGWEQTRARSEDGYVMGVAREAYPGHVFADGQDRILEVEYFLGSQEAWDASREKASGAFNSFRTRLGLVLAFRSTGL